MSLSGKCNFKLHEENARGLALPGGEEHLDELSTVAARPEEHVLSEHCSIQDVLGSLEVVVLFYVEFWP